MTNPNPVIVRAAILPAVSELLTLREASADLRARVDAIKTKVLSSAVYSGRRGVRVTDPSKDWTMDNFSVYLEVLDAAVRAEIGDDHKPDYCPALIAEEATRAAEQKLIEAAFPFFGVTTSQLLCGTKGQSGLSTRTEFLSLLVKLGS